MAEFLGYLFKAVSTNKVFPLEYIKWEGYKGTPNQREEIKAYRDENTRNLHRVTATGKKSRIDFTVREGLHLADKKAVQKWFTDAESSAAERKIQIQYWNDEDNQYETGYFYRPDIEFEIKKVLPEERDIIYKELAITLVEY